MALGTRGLTAAASAADTVLLSGEILREGENHANGYDFHEAMHAKRYHSHFSISPPFLHEKLLSAILRQHGVVLERKEKTQT